MSIGTSIKSKYKVIITVVYILEVVVPFFYDNISYKTFFKEVSIVSFITFDYYIQFWLYLLIQTAKDGLQSQ